MAAPGNGMQFEINVDISLFATNMMTLPVYHPN